MYTACSTLCFGKSALDEALRHIREMRFTKADLALHESGPHLRPSEVARDVPGVAQKLRASNVGFAALHLEFGDVTPELAKERLHAMARLARLLAVPLVTVATSPAGSDFEAEVSRLAEWNRVVVSEGVILSIETRAGTLAEDPNLAAELCERVRGLAITLDPTCMICGRGSEVDSEILLPYIKHVRLRDSGEMQDQFQVRVGQGAIEYGKIVTNLERYRYDRALVVDVRDGAESSFPVEPEVRKLKYLLESLV